MERNIIPRQAGVTLALAAGISLLYSFFLDWGDSAGGAIWAVTGMGLLATGLLWFRLGYLALREGCRLSWLSALICFVPYGATALVNYLVLPYAAGPDMPAGLLIAGSIGWRFFGGYVTGLEAMVADLPAMCAVWTPLLLYAVPLLLGCLAFRLGKSTASPMD